MLERFQRRPACHEPLSLRVQSNGACSQVLAQMPPVFSIGSQTVVPTRRFRGGCQERGAISIPCTGSSKVEGLNPVLNFIVCAFALFVFLYIFALFFNGNLFSSDGFFNFHLAKSDIYLDSRQDSIFIWLASFEYSMKTSAKRLQRVSRVPCTTTNTIFLLSCF